MPDWSAAPRVLLDDARPGRARPTVFADPVGAVRADRPDEIEPALEAVQAHLAAGRHAAGYLSYELGYVLEPCLLQRLWPTRQVPLLWFGIFDAPRHAEGGKAERLLSSPGRAYAGPLRTEWDRPAYGPLRPNSRYDRRRRPVPGQSELSRPIRLRG
jgi:para-aminobenzoate synthetase / 4-amino-4-deoxychorismate lyase